MPSTTSSFEGNINSGPTCLSQTASMAGLLTTHCRDQLAANHLFLMMRIITLACFLLSLNVGSYAHVVRRQDSPTVSPMPASTSTNVEPCAIASSLSLPSGTASPLLPIPPSKALACLKSVPVDVENDAALIEYLIPYVLFQSSLGDLTEPPSGYLLPGFDILGGLEEIKSKLFSGGYSNQWEFAQDLYSIFTEASDGHFNYKPSLLTVFRFRIPRNVISISSDGISPPKIYDLDDVLFGPRQGYQYSDIISIDNVPIEEYLVSLAKARSQDPDAKYNSLFVSAPFDTSSSFGQEFRRLHDSLPDESVWRFSNGTTRTILNVAVFGQLPPDIIDGDDLHAAFELPPPETTSPSSVQKPSATSTQLPPPNPTVAGYPWPVEKHFDDNVSGYFLNGSYTDTCVMAVLSFSPPEQERGNGLIEFRRVVRDTIDACKKANRTKLIIDLSANPGGHLLPAFELYRSLFPTTDIWDGSRIRAFDTFDFIGQMLWDIPDGRRFFIDNTVDKDHKSFASWSDVYGPVTFPHDSLTSLLRKNFSAPEHDGFLVTGFNTSEPARKQPFAAKDIVIVTDGFCHSTCPTLLGLLTREHSIRTIALGGRPLDAPMQAMGGVKGAQSLNFHDLYNFIDAAVKENNNNIPSVLAQSGLFPSLHPAPSSPSSTPRRRAAASTTATRTPAPAPTRTRRCSSSTKPPTASSSTPPRRSSTSPPPGKPPLTSPGAAPSASPAAPSTRTAPLATCPPTRPRQGQEPRARVRRPRVANIQRDRGLRDGEGCAGICCCSCGRERGEGGCG
ncbi:hypothetical protein B0H67DRAFT_181649 [Lasiosphaeris hirsuta]|uniref:CPAF-like PDZ domain-containing protein n=1 Tax=Lasiosphaeris hirsuta TaxID=260670 RepID=A0AA40DXP7_9PEZI|nr:hypothetical protein B0H67DRAFT_181649 [Lasiosphaeris hirsuta]